MAESLAGALAGEPVWLGSENRAKREAVRQALASFASEPSAIRIETCAAESGVPDQPIGWQEIRQGACNRARAAWAAATRARDPGERRGGGVRVLAVGIEDGLVRLVDAPPGAQPDAREPAIALEPDSRAYLNVGCAWLYDGEREGDGYSAGFAYPPACLDRAVAERAPIGDLFDRVWQAERKPSAAAASEAVGESPAPLASGRGGGNIGLLTQGRLERSAYGAQAVVCALVRFLHTDLYD